MSTSTEFHESMRRLASHIGPEVLSIPLVIRPGMEYPACTNADGIWLSSDVTDKEPANVEVYVAHEIGHHVIGDPEQTSRFHPYIVNLAEDYKINQMIEELFGYDVLKVAFQGMRDKKYDDMTVREVAQSLMKEGVTSYNHYAQRLPNREILAAAHVWKTRYKVGNRKTHFLMDGVDHVNFIRAIEPAVHQIARVNTLSNINVSATIQGLWARLFMSKTVHTVPTRTHEQVIGPSRAITYCSNVKGVRESTAGNAARAACVAALVLEGVDSDDRYWRGRLQHARDQLSDIQDELAFRRANGGKKSKFIKKRIRDLLDRENSLKESIIRIENMTPLKVLLEKRRVKVRPGKRVVMPTLRLTMQSEAEGDVRLPNLVSSELTRRIASASRRNKLAIKNYIQASEQSESLNNLLDSDPSKVRNRMQANRNSDDDDDGDGLDRQDVPSTSISVGDGESPSEDRGTSTEIVDGNGVDSNPVRDIRRASSDKRAGKGESPTPVTDISKELFILNNTTRLLNIIHLMRELESLMSNKSRRRVEDNPTLPVGLSYGDELENVDASEFALLANEHTKLDFFVRLSQSSLLMRSPVEKRQSAVVVCIDTSGYMIGGCLELAIAFTLALGNKLRAQGRGMGLIAFHSNVYLSLCFSDKPSIADLLKAFHTIRTGGTDFRPPIVEALDMRDEMKWRETVFVLVTDGEGVVHEPSDIRRRLTHRDSMQLALIGNHTISDPETRNLFSEFYAIEKKDMKIGLVSLARKLL